ncbi:MAG: TPM domain-containing protein, partial [Pseudomonadota bacterium]
MGALRRLMVMVFGCGVMITAVAQELVAVPKQTARVMDTAGLLTPAQRDALEQQLAAYESAKGTQIAVLTVPSSAPEVIEQYGIRVAEAWKTGRKGIADGAILQQRQGCIADDQVSGNAGVAQADTACRGRYGQRVGADV